MHPRSKERERAGERAILNPNKGYEFSLDEHKARTAKVFADYEEYRKILCDLNRRVELLEDIIKEDTDS